MEFDPVSNQVIGCAIEVHRHLGPGLLESAYQKARPLELLSRGVKVAAQVPIPVRYKTYDLDCGFRIDLLVEDSVVVELKSVESIAPVHKAQLLTYLRLSGHRIGLLINFNVPLLTQGLDRIIL
jgi:GxxExxY protein